MNFLKTSLLSGISTVVKLLSNFVINKIIAIYIGPSGIALIGQFQNFLGIITTIGNGAINSGVTKYVAEYSKTDEKKRNDLIHSAFIISAIFSLVVGGTIFLSSNFLSSWILKSEEFDKVFKLLGAALFFININTILLSILNGMKKIKLFITINITSSLFSLVITSLLTILYGLFGAILAMVIVQGIILLITLPLALKKLDFKFQFKKVKYNIHYKNLLNFSLMTIVSVVSVSLTQIFIRSYLVDTFSMAEAGYWQSVWMISNMYLMILTTAFSTYYLPRMSELNQPQELRQEIISGNKIILPFVLLTALVIYLLRDFIIIILFTPEFMGMRKLFLYQLIGDFLKMASWTLSYLLIAKAMTKSFIITEILFSFSFYGLSVWLTQMNGLIGVTQAHALNYFGYLITMIVLFSKILFIQEEKHSKVKKKISSL